MRRSLRRSAAKAVAKKHAKAVQFQGRPGVGRFANLPYIFTVKLNNPDLVKRVSIIACKPFNHGVLQIKVIGSGLRAKGR